MELIRNYPEVKKCSKSYVLAINDTLNVLSGKWKMPIIGSLLYGNKRFKDIQNSIDKITPRMLSKELKDLEINGVIQRKVHNNRPVLIEYELTESGKNITFVLDSMVKWGLNHRKIVLDIDLKCTE
ncbi:winged helix-turn-helix transcriptional regulator [Tenacibaculum sp. M341]|uniref:winged helix-turn-helix transcriptional regulator n=1 Tax=Tenacibaculum sp. M341 TaxID=2530339 RepID=UPI00104A04D7|nr:helix-turn-helix domain-containing protein [Tenacibaculum sp. M341]TCI91061.1 transcriptional regulator [Tenacibaculum sp. M341]